MLIPAVRNRADRCSRPRLVPRVCVLTLLCALYGYVSLYLFSEVQRDHKWEPPCIVCRTPVSIQYTQWASAASQPGSFSDQQCGCSASLGLSVKTRVQILTLCLAIMSYLMTRNLRKQHMSPQPHDTLTVKPFQTPNSYHSAYDRVLGAFQTISSTRGYHQYQTIWR